MNPIEKQIARWGKLRKSQLETSAEDQIQTTLRRIRNRPEPREREPVPGRILPWALAAVAAALILALSVGHHAPSHGVRVVYDVRCEVNFLPETMDRPIFDVSAYESLFLRN